MSDGPPLFVELCAGTAALSLRLAHPRARPPVSRMGAKTGYADVILRCMGLRPGQGAEHYLWCEPDAGVRLLLHAYRDRELATAAVAIIRGWKDEEPRALWERLRAEGPAACPPVDPREVAPGVVAYIDPPYLNTTGYAHLFPRAEWLPVVRRWRDAGALVVVSEAEPIPELMADGWRAVRIDGERRGQKRTFSKQQAEWLTMSEPPRWRPSVQSSLFGSVDAGDRTQ